MFSCKNANFFVFFLVYDVHAGQVNIARATEGAKTLFSCNLLCL